VLRAGIVTLIASVVVPAMFIVGWLVGLLTGYTLAISILAAGFEYGEGFAALAIEIEEDAAFRVGFG